jgi:hypothetical protein
LKTKAASTREPIVVCYCCLTTAHGTESWVKQATAQLVELQTPDTEREKEREREREREVLVAAFKKYGVALIHNQ